ncbi:MAG: branched chain amino acid aminotransferase, partial [Stenotrophomonas nitritireducens]|nr:branched chain amino acid aminotransferase [Stenotrophomonas nitritireducens]
MSQSLSFHVTRSDHPRSAAERAKILEKPGFGLHFTDHMVAVRWDKDTGWHDAAVMPYGPIALDPAAAVLHYGQEIFEGIKAYRHADGSVWTFRPEANGRRLQRSAARLALPGLPVEIFVESLKQMIAVDRDWVSGADEASLYFRPFMIGDEAFLGVRGAHKASYYVIASPAGPYFAKGVAPVAIWLSTH